MPRIKKSSGAPTADDFKKVYVVFNTSGYAPDGFHSPEPQEFTTDSAYLSEDQAYGAAIRKQIAYMEDQTGDTQEELRILVTKKGASFKDRFKSMTEWIDINDWFADSEVVKYEVKSCRVVPPEKADIDDLLDGLDERSSGGGKRRGTTRKLQPAQKMARRGDQDWEIAF